MSRYRYTPQDVKSLLPFLQGPMAARLLAAAVPIKHFEPPSRQVETVELPVAVRSRDQPDGVPLQDILAAAKAASPTVRGLAVRGGTVVVIHDRAPAPQARKKLRDLLGDRQKLTELRGPPTPEAAAGEGDDLRRVLLDDATPDREWLRTFRRYAVQRLIEPDGHG
jgi:hypothetical protein